MTPKLPLFLGVVSALATPAYADVFTNVPEASDFTLLYELPIPDGPVSFRDSTGVPYSVNNSGSVGLYDRIGYYLELDGGQYVYASMDAFDLEASHLALPHNTINPRLYQQAVSNMNVVSNVGGIVTGTGLSTGNIEFWPSNYNGSNSAGVPNASGTTFDFGDGGAGVGSGYGSFQVHNHDLDGAGAGTAGQTLFAYNRWGGGGPNPSDLGIGNGGGNPDWTFAQNANTYSVKNLQVVVHEVAPPALPGLPAAPASALANVPEAAAYGLVYALPIQTSAFNTGQYTVDNSALVPTGSFDRVAYFLELDGPSGPQYAWASMDAYTLNAANIGVPSTTDQIYQMVVNNLNIASNVGAVTNGFFEEGNIEFWPTNYGGTAVSNLLTGGTGSFDFNDTRSTGGAYGSMQVHNFGLSETIFSFNDWNGGSTELGIGNRSTGNPDWTFADNAGSYTVRNLYVLVNPAPEPTRAAFLALGAVALLARRRRA